MSDHNPARNLIHRAGHRLERAEHVVEAFVVILSAIAWGIGLSMLWVPSAYNVASLRVALDLFPAHVWGGALFAIATSTMVALRGDRTTIAATLAGQTVVWGAWGACLIAGVRDGVPSGAIAYTGLTWLCFIPAVYFWRTRNRGGGS